MRTAMPAPLRRLMAVLVVAVLFAGPAGGSASAHDVVTLTGTSAGAPTLAQLVGQKLLVAMSGTVASSSLLGRVSRGEVGGIVLFGANIAGAASLRALTDQLQAAAAAGGQPPLLIAADQEGGSVERVPWAPPSLSPPRMGTLGAASTTVAQGKATGHVLRCAGINADLAPVADVPASTASFMFQQGRTWSFSAATTASMSGAFAAGLADGGSVAVMKHFPGIGYATSNTDSAVVTIQASASDLAPGLKPYQAAIADGLPMVMLSNATYPAYDPTNAAGWSSAISTVLLRDTLGFTGVTVTDSLTGTAAARGVSPTSLALSAARAGTDMLMLTGPESSTAATYSSLLDAASTGTIPLAVLEASYARIVALKGGLKAAVADMIAPAVSAPVSRLQVPSRLGPATVRVSTAWRATDPCAVGGSWLERSANGGSWAFQRLATSLSTSAAQSLAVGATYRYAARATDGAGNRSGWILGHRVRPLLTQQSSSAVRYRGAWSSASSTAYSGGSTRWSSSAGATAGYTFTGTDVAWVAATGPTRGSAAVYVDGRRTATVSLHATTTNARRLVWAAHWSTQGTHTLRIVVIGTAGHRRVDIDGFVRLVRP